MCDEFDSILFGSPFQNHLTTAGSHKPRFENTVEKGPRFVFDGAQYFDSTWGSPLSGSQYSVTMCARVEEHTPGPYATILSQHSADGGRCMGFISNDAHFSTEQVTFNVLLVCALLNGFCVC